MIGTLDSGNFKFEISDSKEGQAKAAAPDQLRIRYVDFPGRRLGIPISGPAGSEEER